MIEVGYSGFTGVGGWGNDIHREVCTQKLVVMKSKEKRWWVLLLTVLLSAAIVASKIKELAVD